MLQENRSKNFAKISIYSGAGGKHKTMKCQSGKRGMYEQK